MLHRSRVPLVLIASALVVGTVPSSAVAAHEIEGQYIVVLKDQAGGDTAKRKVRARGGNVQREFSRALNGFSAKLDSKALAEVAQGPRGRLRRARPPDHARGDADQPAVGPGPHRPAQPAAQRHVQLDADRRGRDRLHHRHRDPHDAHELRRPRDARATTRSTAAPRDDCNGHGTHVAGTVGGSTYGVAKGVRLIAVRVLNCSGSGSTSGVIAGIDWVTVAPSARHAGRGQHEPRRRRVDRARRRRHELDPRRRDLSRSPPATRTRTRATPRPRGPRRRSRSARRPRPTRARRSPTTASASTCSRRARRSCRPGTRPTPPRTRSAGPRWRRRTSPARPRWSSRARRGPTRARHDPRQRHHRRGHQPRDGLAEPPAVHERRRAATDPTPTPTPTPSPPDAGSDLRRADRHRTCVSRRLGIPAGHQRIRRCGR